MPYRKPSTRFQINATHDIVFQVIAVATIQDEANLSSSQPAAFCRVASESAEAFERKSATVARIRARRRECLFSEKEPFSST